MVCVVIHIRLNWKLKLLYDFLILAAADPVFSCKDQFDKDK